MTTPLNHHAIILDTETHALHGYPIEVAYLAVDINTNGLQRNDDIYDELFSLDADTQINLASMAVHHILPEDLTGKPNFREFKLPSETIYIIGHNIDYDIQAISRCQESTSHLKPICTLALARSIWPHLESHALSSLSYFISQDWQHTRQILRNAHQASTDVLLTADLLDAILRHYREHEKTDITSIEQLYQVAKLARLPKFMPFGKHKGTPLKEVPIDYVDWLLGQENLDPNLREALEFIYC
ncbi:MULTISPECIES: putative quorum-sensing-regulated virulence factor [unclassified Acinetobacter]|uniref:3'-5' exonuclease n=1 Tax=unclassified Acinetobacter TaxID=196816 RepID=UPI0035B7C126